MHIGLRWAPSYTEAHSIFLLISAEIKKIPPQELERIFLLTIFPGLEIAHKRNQIREGAIV